MNTRAARDLRAWTVIAAALAVTTHQSVQLHFSATAVGAAVTLTLMLAWAYRRHREEALS